MERRRLSALAALAGLLLVVVGVAIAATTGLSGARQRLDSRLDLETQQRSDAIGSEFARIRSLVLIAAKHPSIGQLLTGPADDDARKREVEDLLNYLNSLVPRARATTSVLNRNAVALVGTRSTAAPDSPTSNPGVPAAESSTTPPTTVDPIPGEATPATAVALSELTPLEDLASSQGTEPATGPQLTDLSSLDPPTEVPPSVETLAVETLAGETLAGETLADLDAAATSTAVLDGLPSDVQSADTADSADPAALAPDADHLAATLLVEPGQTYQSHPHARADGMWVIVTATPVRSGASAVGVLQMEIPLEELLPTRPAEGTRVRIVDVLTGVVLSDSLDPNRTLSANSPQRFSFSSQLSATGMDLIDGHRVMARRASDASHNSGSLFVVTSAPNPGLNAGFGPFEFSLMLVGGVAIFAALAAVRRFSHDLRVALHDELTGLPSRRLVQSELADAVQLAVRNSHRGAVLLIDLNHFKEVNDTLGHHMGDELLREVGRRFAGAVRTGDKVGRLGGDEFAIVLPVVEDADAAIAVAARIEESLTEPVMLDTVPIDVRAAIGLALFPDHGSDVATLLRRADVAMYEAKRASESQVVYEEATDAHTPKRLALGSELRAAIGERNELVLLYQPKVSLDEMRIVGVEALVRWNHPRDGMLRPDEFLPVAERLGLLWPLTEWVLSEAARQAAEWQRAGRNWTVAVNLSSEQLTRKDIVGLLRQVRATYGIHAGLIGLEVTEGALVADPLRAADVMRRLRATGATLSIDDFGTGYSSLAYLKHLPADELKIDRTFVSGMLEDTADGAIVEALIRLAHHLGMKVVAEGVEHTQQANALRAMGCDLAQGYLFSRPVSARELEEGVGSMTRSGLQDGVNV